jgi:predicted dienelactone hydrolase
MAVDKKNAAIIVSIAAVAWIVSPIPAKAVKTIAPDGPFQVGVKVAHARFGGRELRIITWYPAHAESGAKGYKFESGIRGSGVLDVPPDRAGAPYPLLLFSHGLGGSADQSVYYCQNLASHGYVVVSADHMDKDSLTGNLRLKALGKLLKKLPRTPAEQFGMTATTIVYNDWFNSIGFDLSYRAREASFAIDRALEWNGDENHPLHKMMDPDRIGATGHSLGGFTVIMIGGIPMRCDEPGDFDRECDLKNQDVMDMEFPCCLDFMKQMDPLDMRDERVKAILPLAPAIFVPHLERAAAEIEIPLMLMTGDAVRIEATFPPIKTLYENAPPPKYLIVLKNTDHMTVADAILGRLYIARFILPGFRSHYKDKARAYKDYSVAFFDVYIKGDDKGRKVLDQPPGEFVELWREN